MSAKEQMDNIGKYATIKLRDLTIDVKIEDWRLSFGANQWQVTPVSGSGSLWLEDVYVDGKNLGAKNHA